MKEFPESFIWGGALGGPGMEGGLANGKRGPVLQDYLTAGTNLVTRRVTWKDKFGNEHASPSLNFKLPDGGEYVFLEDTYYPTHKGIDFDAHWKEDLDLFAAMGLKMIRVCLSWSRLFPTGKEDHPSPEGISFYKELFTEMHNRGIEPLVSLWHSSTPLHVLTREGGWMKRELVDDYVRYASFCFEAFKGLVHWWIPFQEMNNALLMTDLSGCEDPRDWYWSCQMIHYQLVAAALCTVAGHNIDPDNKIGCMLCGIPFYPLTPDPEDVWKTICQWQQDLFYTGDVRLKGEYPTYAKRLWAEHDVSIDIADEDLAFLKKGKADFVAFSYYMSGTVTSHEQPAPKNPEVVMTGQKNPYLAYTNWDWSVDPKGLEIFLKVVWDRYHMPILLVENGLGTEDVVEEDGIHDPYRIDYLRDHLQYLNRALENGVDIRGYLVWSPIDSICFSTGQISKRYGLVHVDLNDAGEGTRQRKPKDSYYWYQKVCQSNGHSLIEELTEKDQPALAEQTEEISVQDLS